MTLREGVTWQITGYSILQPDFALQDSRKCLSLYLIKRVIEKSLVALSTSGKSCLRCSVSKNGEVSNYSSLMTSAGLRLAANQLFQLTVNKAISKAMMPANAKNHQSSFVL